MVDTTNIKYFLGGASLIIIILALVIYIKYPVQQVHPTLEDRQQSRLACDMGCSWMSNKFENYKHDTECWDMCHNTYFASWDGKYE